MNKHVDVVRHDKKQMQKPFCRLLVEPRSIQNDIRIVNHNRSAALRSRYCDEIYCIGHINRQRTAMIKRFS
jgi:hypothetical protein